MQAHEFTEAERQVKSEIARRMNLIQHAKPGYHPHRWTPEQLALLGTLPDAEVAERIGRTPNALRVMRDRRGIPSFTGPQHARTGKT